MIATADRRRGTVQDTAEPDQAPTNIVELADHLRTAIVLSGLDENDLRQQAWDAIVAANSDPNARGFDSGNLFITDDSRLVLLDQNAEPARMKPATGGALQAHMDECIRWQVQTANGPRPAKQPPTLARRIEGTPRSDLLKLSRIATTPFFDRDYRYVAQAGYYPESGVWLDTCGLTLPDAITAKLDPAAVQAAVDYYLADVLVDFPFATVADRANALGQFLVPLVREMIDGPCMGCLIEAPTPGSGKTLLAKLVSIVNTGSRANITPLDRKEPEIRKALTASLAAGEPVLVLDNISGYLDSPALAAALSATVWQDRLLGFSQMIKIPITTQFIFTGNNVSMSGELADRLLRVRLVPDTERPRQRTGFKHSNVEAWLLADRQTAIWNLVVLVQNWICKGATYSGPVQGTYESYCHVIGGILEAAGVGGFLGNRDEFVGQAAASESEWNTLARAWWERHRETMATAGQLNDICNELDLLGYLRGEPGTRQASRLSRKISTAMRERIFDGKMICVNKTRDGRPHEFYLKEIPPGYKQVQTDTPVSP